MSFFIDYYQTVWSRVNTNGDQCRHRKDLAGPISNSPAASKTSRRLESRYITSQDGTCEDVRLGLNSVASTILRAKKPKKSCAGNRSTMPLAEKWARLRLRVRSMDDTGARRSTTRDGQSLVRRAAVEALEMKKMPLGFGINAQIYSGYAGSRTQILSFALNKRRFCERRC